MCSGNMFVSSLLMTISILTVFGSAPTVDGVRPRIGTFEDYLQHLGKNLQSSIIMLDRENNVNGTLATAQPTGGNPINTNSVSTDSTKDSQKNFTCCLLGELAGDKGFHCFAEFYAARVVLRNINRTHSKKLGFHGRFKIPGYGRFLTDNMSHQ